jgi:Uma2 family endonuclease
VRTLGMPADRVRCYRSRMQAHVPAHAEPRRVTRAEYERMAELGFFRGERVELIHGIVVAMSPIGPAHADPVDVLNELLVQGLRGRARVRIQQPYLAYDDSEPEPDVAVVPPGRYANRHPDRAFLIIEVAERSLDYDRETKAPLYAASGVGEYWVVDVTGRAVEVYREAIEGRYTAELRVVRGETLSPKEFSDVEIAVSDLFA